MFTVLLELSHCLSAHSIFLICRPSSLKSCAFCYPRKKVLLSVVNLLMCLTYKLNFIIGIYGKKKNSIFSVQYYPLFQASIGCLGLYLLGIRGYYCMHFLMPGFFHSILFLRFIHVITYLQKKQQTQNGVTSAKPRKYLIANQIAVSPCPRSRILNQSVYNFLVSISKVICLLRFPLKEGDIAHNNPLFLTFLSYPLSAY